MGRIAEKNRRYRTKDEMVRDLVFILKSKVKDGTKWAVARDVAWAWTEFDGKYNGCALWTEKARVAHRRDKKVALRHEHAVPRKIVIDMLLDLKSPTPKRVREICEKFLVGVVVTLEEDRQLNRKYRSTMPEGFSDKRSGDYKKPLLRYERCGIEVASEGKFGG